MDETTQTPEALTEPQLEVTPSRLQTFVNKHPRAAKVTAIIGAVTTAVGAVHLTRTVQANRRHVEQAGEHAKEALIDLSTAVSPPPDPEA